MIQDFSEICLSDYKFISIILQRFAHLMALPVEI
jgi:hypothetical protein